VTVLPGVHIGNGAIIGANSVVGKNIEPYCIAVGNPVRIVRKRFDDEMINLLQKLQWWNLPLEQIKQIIPLLHNSDIEYVKGKIQKLLEQVK
jgi:virginiamycin A acetyltransferase